MATVEFKVKNLKAADGTRATLAEIAGSIDATSIVTFQNVMDKLLDKGVKNLILDCASVKYINSTGLGTLLKYIDTFEAKDGHIVFTRIPSKVALVMEMLGFNALFTIVPDEAAGLRLFAGKPGPADIVPPAVPGVRAVPSVAPRISKPATTPSPPAVALHRNAESGALRIGGLPRLAFEGGKTEWLGRFMAQPLEKARAIIVDVPPGCPDGGLRTILRLAAGKDTPVRFTGGRARKFESVFAPGLKAAERALAGYPRASPEARVEPPGVFVVRWRGDLVPATVKALERRLEELSGDGGFDGARAAVAELDRRAGGVTMYSHAAASEVASLLEARWLDRVRVFDKVGQAEVGEGEAADGEAGDGEAGSGETGGGEPGEFGDEWPCYFPDVFSYETHFAKKDGKAELTIEGVLTGREIRRYFRPEKPGRLAALRLRPGSFLTRHATEALGEYLAARSEAGCPPLVLEGFPPGSKEMVSWHAGAWVEVEVED